MNTSNKITGTYHYLVSNLGGVIIGVYGKALRDFANECAARHRSQGIACEIYTQTGPRLSINSTLAA